MAELDIELTGKENPSERSIYDAGMKSEQILLPGSDTRLDDTEKALKLSPSSMMDPNAFPEGGREVWLIVAGSSACLVWMGELHRLLPELLYYGST